MSDKPDFLARLSKDKSNCGLTELFYQAWADSHRLVADGYAGSCTLSGWVEGQVKSFAQVAEIQIAVKDGTSVTTKCREMDELAEQAVRISKEALDREAERLGKKEVAAASGELVRRISEITARTKQRMFEKEIAKSSDGTLDSSFSEPAASDSQKQVRDQDQLTDLPNDESLPASHRKEPPIRVGEEKMKSEPGGLSSLDEEGWVRIRRADWRQDAAYARECPAVLRPAKAARLSAIATLHQEAAATVQTTLPQTKPQLEQQLWPVFRNYAEEVFDKMAATRLGSSAAGRRSKAYSRWLRLKCLPAVVDDVCKPIFGQFQITVRYAVEIIGDGESQAVVATKRALWGMLTEILGEKPFTENLEKRLSALLEGRSTHWEGQAAQPSPAAAPKAKGRANQADADTVMDAFRNLAGVKAADSPGNDVIAEDNSRQGNSEITKRAHSRQAVVMPILKMKGWTRGRWVTEAGVSKNSVYEYLEGKRNLSEKNRTAMAEELDLTPKQLPE